MRAMTELGKYFRPEFLNRIDEIALFHALKPEQLVSIVDIKVADLVERLKDKRISLDLTDAAKAYLAEAGYSATFGARPLKRVIQNEVETRIAKLIVAGEVPEGSIVRVDSNGAELIVEVSSAE
jgi:ATP-dependent Clp protease ATP-binding subunit ClpB